MEQNGMLHHAWDSTYILLSYVIAVVASYMSLELAGRAGRNFRSVPNRFWLVAQALVLGYGIWAMHFVGMMAFKVNAATSLNMPLTLLSGVAAVALVYVALLYLHAAALKPARLAVAGAIAGTGIVIMHYTGMAAYRMPGTSTQIAWLPLIASVIIAVGASMVALYLFHLLTSEWAARQRRLALTGLKAVAAAVMGVAVVGMHYTGMAALNYKVMDDMKLGVATNGIDTTLLGLVVGVVSFLLMGLAITSILMDASRSGDTEDLDFGTAAD